MAFNRVMTVLGVLALVSLSGCGYLPSEMEIPDAKESEGKEAEAKPDKAKPEKAEARAEPRKAKRTAHARIRAKPHTVDCDTPARGFQQVAFDDLYTITGDSDAPFREADDRPAQFNVAAYVWGSDRCSQYADCEQGDHYWLIGKGPRGDYRTWVVTPQFPRIPIQSTCRDKLKVGERFRFSFSHGKLVGFSQ